MTDQFPAKDPRESIVLTFDASAELASGETLTSIASTDVTLDSCTDSDAADIVETPIITAESVTVGSTTIATAHAVQAASSGGVNNCVYRIAITCNTSNADKILTLKGILPVSNQ
jgi:hypothetical protein